MNKYSLTALLPVWLNSNRTQANKIMRILRAFSLAAVVFFSLVAPTIVPDAGATAAIGFLNSDSFDGDVAGSLSGPFTDPTTLVTGLITTTGVMPGGSLVNTTSGQLGINAPGSGDIADSFDGGEGWSFKWDQNSQFAGIDFGNYSTTTENLAFSIQCSAWIGLGITPGSANVVFNGLLGTFNFKDGTASDIFTVTDLYGGGVVPTIPAGTDLMISYAPAGADNALIQGISFNLTTVPEPSAFALLALGLVLASRTSRRSNHRSVTA